MTWSGQFFRQKLCKGCPIGHAKFQRNPPSASGAISEKRTCMGDASPTPLCRRGLRFIFGHLLGRLFYQFILVSKIQHSQKSRLPYSKWNLKSTHWCLITNYKVAVHLTTRARSIAGWSPDPHSFQGCLPSPIYQTLILLDLVSYLMHTCLTKPRYVCVCVCVCVSVMPSAECYVA